MTIRAAQSDHPNHTIQYSTVCMFILVPQEDAPCCSRYRRTESLDFMDVPNHLTTTLVDTWEEAVAGATHSMAL